MRTLTIVAHPDDEVLWSWPVMQADDNDRWLYIVSDNSQTYGTRAMAAAKELKKRQGYELLQYEYTPGSQFYRLPFRRAVETLPNAVTMIREAIRTAVMSVGPDVVFTHNPVGEYGHGDHKLLFELVATCDKVKRLRFSDICLANDCHVSYNQIPKHIRQGFYKEAVAETELDSKWYAECQVVYERHRAWSWKSPVVKGCKVYEIRL